MPGMAGEQVLAEIQADTELAGTPVVIVTSERGRAKACMSRGAAAYLVKPLRAEDVSYVVEQSLAKARTDVARPSMPVLPIGIGRFELAVPLEAVREVVWMTLVSPLPAGPAYLTSFVEARGELVCVLDLAARFGIEHGEPLVERKLVIVEHGGTKLALCVDRVHDPEDVAPSEIGASALPDLDASALIAMVKTARGPVPVIQAHALLSRGLVRRLPELLREAGA
jgi:chemotaxis signal transduction protein